MSGKRGRPPKPAPHDPDRPTHRYTGPTVRYKGMDGLPQGAYVRIVGKGPSGTVKVQMRGVRGQFAVTRAQLQRVGR